eukprot:CAMPEP_0181207360 /NCGR_PEP_ID=MMETSP1096-20121128/21545_1 /TAXON_ID=156174 ORGANISM="Chrysochromulina ericina, Strain CCMP281" /NCGR_SAMPLE_ID=MMETSP1096 /ASSEMBLY_ACC=CAM_ASM_000453 /LENGTH=169 /DNA_ID=CAMNT_0023298357 /DNA_START=336 /DNA_END=841 /DNA_ORIENTATION=+
MELWGDLHHLQELSVCSGLAVGLLLHCQRLAISAGVLGSDELAEAVEPDECPGGVHYLVLVREQRERSDARANCERVCCCPNELQHHRRRAACASSLQRNFLGEGQRHEPHLRAAPLCEDGVGAHIQAVHAAPQRTFVAAQPLKELDGHLRLLLCQQLVLCSLSRRRPV